MSQSKDADPTAAASRAESRGDRDRRLRSLLEERARLLGRLRRVDRLVADLRREALEAESSLAEDDAVVSFCLRGEDAERGDFEPPPGIDVEDLRDSLTKVLLAARRSGSRIEGLELAIDFERKHGRVRSIAARRAGTLAWIPQLRRSHDGGVSPIST